MTHEKAQKGDLIRAVVSCNIDGYSVGDILEVRQSSEIAVSTECGSILNHGEYVIHRKAGEEDIDGDVGACASCGADIVGSQLASYPEGTTFSPNGLFPIEPTDAVNPQHYKQGRVEVIDIIEDAVEGADPFEAVCQANVLKYALRYRHKNGVEDLRKSIWYTEKLIAYLDAKSTQK